MNKISILIVFIFLFGANNLSFAQDLTMEITNSNGDIIENGSNLFSVANSTTNKIISTDSLYVKNISDSPIKVKVRKSYSNIVAGSFNIFTALAQNMTADETITPNAWDLESGASLPKEAFIKGSYYPQTNVGTSTIVYSFLSVDDNGQVLDSVYVVYAFSNTSVTPLDSDGNGLYFSEVLINCGATEVSEYAVNLENHTAETVSFRASKTVLEIEEGQSAYFKFGGVEYPVEVNGSDGSGVSIASGATLGGDNGFIALFNANSIDGNVFLPKVQYKFFNKIAGNDAVFVTLLYAISGVGFEDLNGYQVSKAYPNPASNYFNVDVNLPEYQEAYLKVYNPAGALIGQFPINNPKSTITVSTNQLSAGVYFFTIETDGNSIGVDKVIIK